MSDDEIKALEMDIMGSEGSKDDNPIEEIPKKPTKSQIRCLIHYRTCKWCESLFISKTAHTQYCGDSCKQKASYKRNRNYYKKKTEYVKYFKECVVCNTLYETNKVKSKLCSDECRSIHKRNKARNGRSCLNCNKHYSGRSHYCSTKCKEEKNKKVKLCATCDKTLENQRLTYCSKECKPKKTKGSTLQNKECHTCNCEFETKTSQQVYCKPGHVPSAIESKKLRKRTVRKAKLNVEKWDDTLKFKEDRPNNNHLDHIIPLNHPDVCGLHNTWNFQWLSPEDNIRKSNDFDGTMENESWRKK